MLLGLEVFLDIAGRFYRGESPPSREQLAQRLDTSPAEVDVFADLLLASGLVTFAGQEGDRLMPARSLDRISLQDLMGCLFRGSPRSTRRGGAALGLYDAAIAAAGGYLADRTVLDFIKGGYKP
jgi:membrane protein